MRRVQPLVRHLLGGFSSRVDANGTELSDIVVLRAADFSVRLLIMSHTRVIDFTPLAHQLAEVRFEDVEERVNH